LKIILKNGNYKLSYQQKNPTTGSHRKQPGRRGRHSPRRISVPCTGECAEIPGKGGYDVTAFVQTKDSGDAVDAPVNVVIEIKAGTLLTRVPAF